MFRFQLVINYIILSYTLVDLSLQREGVAEGNRSGRQPKHYVELTSQHKPEHI
jgi:hypothetical protein